MIHTLDAFCWVLYNGGAMINKKLLSALSFCLFCLGVCSRVSADPLAASLDAILDMPAMHGGITGATVVRVRDGQTLYAHNLDVRLLPASNRKLFTTAAGLELLGANFTWTTQVLAAAKPDVDGTLKGDLVLKGVGDSSLKTADLDDLAAQISNSGVKRITGNVIGDGSAFTDGPYGFGWEWDDFSDEEFPQIAGLEVNDGDVAVHLDPRAAGQSPIVTLDPPLTYIPVINTALTLPKAALVTIAVSRTWNQNILNVTGGMNLPRVVNVPIMEPPCYAATVFAQCLTHHGVILGGQALMGKAPPEVSVVLAAHKSVPLGPYLALINKPSDNLLAESLVRTLGAVKGQGGAYDAGHAVETPFFQKLGVDTASIALVDGCGVGRRNFVTARAVGQLLLGMSRQADFKFYYDSLPIAGVDGTLKTRLKGTKAEGTVHAKTGTLSQVRCLSGYLTGTRGDLYVFSLLMNNFPGTAHDAGDVQDRFITVLADSL